MNSRNRRIPVLVVFALFLFLVNVSTAVEPATSQPSPAAVAAAPSSATNHDVVAKAPTSAPDVRALSPKEIALYRARADSTAQNQQLQQMNVGMRIDTTIVLSVVVALVIFAVLVAVL